MDYTKDYYIILDVDEKASREALRDSYRRKAKLHHPDRNPGDPDAEERFKAINEAYEILSNEITRHIYDSYRAKNKIEDGSQPSGRYTGKANIKKPFTTTKTRTYTVKREKRVYVQGSIEVKFQGDPELYDTYLNQREQRYTIIPTEVMATITTSAIYKDGPPKEYQLGYSTSELFKTPLKQPVNCRVITGNQEEYYQLELYEIRVKDPRLKDITRHDQYSFGTLEGMLFAYVLEQFEEEVTEQYTEYSGPTGHIEIKTEAGYTFTRQQFYANDGSTFWTEWTRSPLYQRKQRTTSTSSYPNFSNDNWAGVFWLFVLLIMVALYPKMLLVILPMIAWFLLIALFGWIISAFDRLLPWIGGLAIGLIIFFAARSLFQSAGHRMVRATSSREVDSVSTEKAIVRGKDNQVDTIIRHNLFWEDRDSSRYFIQLSISSSALHVSSAAHDRMDYQQFGVLGIGAVYSAMLETDNYYLDPIATAFDSLAKARSLDDQQKASMIISCFQSIPYTLVVDGSCSANYNDEYVRQYLANCANDCCKGYSKFGVQSPVEFLCDPKGDCDTRALLLYDVLGKLGFHVALLTSNYYKHALIAVHLDEIQTGERVAIRIGGEPYYLWETTSKGFGPGEIPPALSNINYWNIALLQ